MSHVTDKLMLQTATVASKGSIITERTAASTKDLGRVKVGGMAIRFKSASAGTKDSGRVQIGGMAIRF